MKRNTYLLAIVFTLSFLFPEASKATDSKIFISASYLYEICARDGEGGEAIKGGHTACQAYISGVIDYHNLLETLGTAPSIQICIPNTVALGDLQDVVWDYLDKNPQHDSFAAAPAITLALSHVFPCKKKKRK